MDIVSALGLSSASGLNAYIPMLILGLLDRFTTIVSLPAGWEWLSNSWMLAIVTVLLIIEIVADKVPALDSFNDIIQTVVRPASGGIVFSSGLSGEPSLVSGTDSEFAWQPFLVGVVIALVIHLLKSLSRPVANVATAGVAAPVISAGEDATSLALSLVAVFIPVLVILILIGMFATIGYVFYRARTLQLTRVHGPDLTDSSP
ncbi:MAG: DUF4126 domain-containing protein [Actinomycetaceae bacterium]|nr:DUF4126 domain-containing protein [Actinomycetaceae bacterium]